MKPISRLTYLGFQLIWAKDGSEQDFSVKEVKNSLENGTMFELLEQRFGKWMDLSLLKQDDRKELTEKFLDIALIVDERKKFGVNKSGLLLVLAYVLEQIGREYPAQKSKARFK